tara:strand:- start:857 stop:1897 length:1041 start_codon:yes stop_codon:yes gene_type:complete
MSSPRKRRRECSHNCKSPDIWAVILQKWTMFVKLEEYRNIEALHNDKGMKEYRFISNENNLISIMGMDAGGNNSDTYLVQIHDKTEEGILKEGILKHFKPKPLLRDLTNDPILTIDPILEAELQRYANRYGLAPAVFASNQTAMISEKCEPMVDLHEPKCYRNVSGLPFQLRTRANRLHILFHPHTTQILDCCKEMYSKIGMFNLDPNNENYMELQGRIIQIDYGANRFQNVDAFEMFFNQLGTFFPRDRARKLLLNGTARYPPTYYMYRYIVSPDEELSEEKQRYNESSWSLFLEQLRVEQKEVCTELQDSFEKLKQEKHAKNAEKITNEMRAYFYTYVLKKDIY